MQDYKIEEAYSYLHLEMKINNKLRDGYQIAGGVSVVELKSGTILYTQAVVKIATKIC